MIPMTTITLPRPAARQTPLTKADWLIPAGLIALTLIPAIAGIARMAEVLGDAPVTPRNARFLADPFPILLHLPFAILYGLLGAFQFSPGLRKRHRTWHRLAGRVLVPSALIVAVSGLWLTFAYPWPAGDGVALYIERLLVGGVMLAAVLLGIDAIRRRDFTAHGAWMTRAYALGMGAGTQVLTHLPWFILMDGWPGETARGVMMGAGWLINAIVAEWIIRRKAPHRAPVARHTLLTATPL